MSNDENNLVSIVGNIRIIVKRSIGGVEVTGSVGEEPISEDNEERSGDGYLDLPKGRYEKNEG